MIIEVNDIEDHHANRGFFSTLICVLLAAVYCRLKGYGLMIGPDVFRGYKTLSQINGWANYFNPIDFGCEKGNDEEVVSIPCGWFWGQSGLMLESNKSRTIAGLIQELGNLSLSDGLRSFLDNSRPCSNDLTPVRWSECIGVHYRGTDRQRAVYDDHLPSPTAEVFFERVLQIVGDDSKPIFLCTDDQTGLSAALERFKRVIYFPDTKRSTDGKSLHWETVVDDDSRIRLGYEVYRDGFYLSRTRTLIGAESNVALFTKILSPWQPMLFVNCL